MTIDQMILTGLIIYALYACVALSLFVWERGEFKKLTDRLFTKQVKRYE